MESKVLPENDYSPYNLQTIRASILLIGKGILRLNEVY